MIIRVRFLLRHQNIGQVQGKIPVVLALLPFYHIYGMAVSICRCLKDGNTVVVLPKFQPKTFLRAIQEYKVINRIRVLCTMCRVLKINHISQHAHNHEIPKV